MLDCLMVVFVIACPLVGCTARLFRLVGGHAAQANQKRPKETERGECLEKRLSRNHVQEDIQQGAADSRAGPLLEGYAGLSEGPMLPLADACSYALSHPHIHFAGSR